MKRFEIGHFPVGMARPLFVIAELGLNHGGSLDRALELVDAAAACGANAVKLQTLRADLLVAAGCPAPGHVRVASLREFFAGFELDEAAHAAIAARAHAHGLAFMSTPFFEDAVALLESAGCDAYKIASGDLTHSRLIERAARTGKPLVISTGMANLGEIADAVACARSAGARRIALLHCVSAYPVPSGSENLRAIAELARVFNLPVGLSDHGTDPMSASLAVTLGASLYERHLVLRREAGDVDAAVSATPGELAAVVQAAARTERLLGHGRKVCLPAEAGNLVASRRGLYAARDLQAGERVADDAVVALRPAAGLDARSWQALVGIHLSRPLRAGEPFLESDLENSHEAHPLVDVA